MPKFRVEVTQAPRTGHIVVTAESPQDAIYVVQGRIDHHELNDGRVEWLALHPGIAEFSVTDSVISDLPWES